MSEMDRKQQVMVIDDHPIVRHGIAMLIDAQPDMACCGQAQDAEQALALLRTVEPDLMVVDISMPGLSGLDLVRRVRTSHPNAAALVLSMHEEAVYAERAFGAGACGFITKQEGTEKLLEAMRKVLTGGIYVSPKFEQRMLELYLGRGRPDKQPPGPNATKLSAREFEVLQMIAQGFTSNDIAQRIHRSVKSVEAYRASIRHKLGARTTADLTRLAVELTRADPQA